MTTNYLIEYIDTFSYNKKLNEIIKKEKFTDNIINEYDLNQIQLDSVLEDLDTYSFLSEKKVIIIKNVELLNIDENKTKHLFKYLDNPNESNLLIMTSTKLDSRKKLTKELKEKTKYILLASDPEEIIKSLLSSYSLESGVIKLIIEYTNSNIDAIKTECDKLMQYKFNEKEITKEDVKTICLKHLTDPTQLTFDLVKYIASINKKEALIAYKTLHENNIDDIGIIGLLESQLRLLMQTSILMGQYKNKKEIASILKIHPYRIEKTMELLRYISIDKVVKLIKDLSEIDYKSKSGIYDTKKPLEILLLNL